MTMNDFAKEMKGYLEQWGPFYQYEVVTVPKNNLMLTGINVKDNSNIGATFYLEDSFKEFKGGKLLEVLAMELFGTINQTMAAKPEFDSDRMLDWDSVKDHVFLKLIQVKGNEAFLSSCIWEKFLDLAVISYVNIGKDMNTPCIKKDLLSFWDVDHGTVMETARENMWSKKLPVLSSINYMMEKLIREDLARNAGIRPEEVSDESVQGILYGMGMEPMGEIPMTIFTTADQIFGAYYLADPKTLALFHEFSEKHGLADLIILPSSVHELILLPKTDSDIDSYRMMVQEVNVTEVSPEERLSDSVYLYLAAENRIVIAE